MKRRLPPLNSLRAFEVAARLSSMSAAAMELNVTQAAVSKHVKNLEIFLRRRLFDRLTREIRLTADGERYFQAVTRILDELEVVTKDLDRDTRQPVRFSGYYGFNMHWLIPRLSEFQSLHPEIEVHLITSSAEAIDFKHNTVDCAIRTGDGKWVDCQVDFIAPIEFRPVCSPSLQRRQNLHRHSQLASVTRIRSLGSPGIWQKWFGLVGIDGVTDETELELDNAALCYQAAIEGLGVAIADCLLVKDYVDSGKLCYPFPETYNDPRSYYFLYRDTPERPGVAQFRSWLLKKLHQSREMMP